MTNMSHVTNGIGRKRLTVYYDAGKDNYDEAITNALAYHGLEEGEAAIIAVPKSSKRMGVRTIRRCRFGNVISPSSAYESLSAFSIVPR